MARKSKSKKADDPTKPWIRGRLNENLNKKSATKRRKNRRKARATKVSKEEVKDAIIKPGTVVFLGVLIILLLWVPFTSYSCTTQRANQECKEIDNLKDVVSAELPIYKRFVPLINEESVETMLLESGLVDSVDVSKTWYNMLKVDLTERSIFAIWRTNSGDSPKYALDRNGVAIKLATDYTADELAEALDVRDNVALTPSPGDGLVETSVITAGLKLASEDLVSDYDLRYLQIDESSREFEAIYQHKKTDKNITILFTTARPLEHQLIDANLSLDHLEEEGVTIRFLDVRLESSTAYR